MFHAVTFLMHLEIFVSSRGQKTKQLIGSSLLVSRNYLGDDQYQYLYLLGLVRLISALRVNAWPLGILEGAPLANALALVGDSHPQPPGGPQWRNLLLHPLQRINLQASSTRAGNGLAVQSWEGV